MPLLRKHNPGINNNNRNKTKRRLRFPKCLNGDFKVLYLLLNFCLKKKRSECGCNVSHANKIALI